MDITKTRFPDVSEYVIRDSNGDETDATISLAGPGHPQRVAFDRRGLSRAVRDYNRRGKAHLNEDAEDLFDQHTDRLVAMTLGWTNITNGNGEAIPFTAENVRRLYVDLNSSLRKQVNDELDRLGSFTPASSRD